MTAKMHPLFRPALYAAVTFMAAAALVVFVSVQTERSVTKLAADHNRIHAEKILAEIQNAIEGRLKTLKIFQSVLNNAPDDILDDFDKFSPLLHEGFQGATAINFIDKDQVIVRVWPPQVNQAALGRRVGQSQEVQALLDQARIAHTAMATRIVSLFQGGRAIVLYFPLYRNDAFEGFLNVVLDFNSLSTIIQSRSPEAFAFDLRNADETDSRTDAAAADPHDSFDFILNILNQSFRLKIEVAAHLTEHDLPEIELIWGLISSLILAAGVFVYYALHNKTRHLHAMISGILNTAPTAILALDANRKIVVFNPAAEAMFKISAQDVIGKPLDQLIPDRFRSIHQYHVEDYSQNSNFNRIMGDWRTIKALRSTGEEFPVLVSIGKSYFQGGEIITAVLRDMSEEAETQQKLIDLATEHRKQAELADAANRAKTMFLATMSHELRTPLNAIIGFSEMMVQEIFGPHGNPRYKAYASDIAASGKSLLDLINDILDLSKIEAGAYSYAIEDFALQPCIDECSRVIFPMAENKDIALNIATGSGLGSSLGMVRADKRAVKQVLSNLLSNAIKFTNKGGAVSVAITGLRPDAVEICVEDTGVGISEANLATLGQPFVQIRDSFVANEKGTGLGLAISRQLLEGMGGALRIESRVGYGTKVYFTLPLAAEPAA